MIELTNVTKDYPMGEVVYRALRGVDVHIAEREYIAVAQGRVTSGRIESRLIENRGDGLRGSARRPGDGQHFLLAHDHGRPPDDKLVDIPRPAHEHVGMPSSGHRWYHYEMHGHGRRRYRLGHVHGRPGLGHRGIMCLLDALDPCPVRAFPVAGKAPVGPHVRRDQLAGGAVHDPVPPRAPQPAMLARARVGLEPGPGARADRFPVAHGATGLQRKHRRALLRARDLYARPRS